MAVSALIPTFRKSDLSREEQEALLVAVEHVQFHARASSGNQDSLLDSALNDLIQTQRCARSVVRACEIIESARARVGYPRGPISISDETLLRATKEACFQSRPRPYGTQNISSPLELKATVRSALRTIRSLSLPALFEDVRWDLHNERLVFSREQKRRSAARTSHGLCRFNPDLDSMFKARVGAANPRVPVSYEIIHLAHDLRWYASKMAPDRARASYGFRPLSQERAFWMSTVLWHDIDLRTSELHEITRREEARERFDEGQKRGRELIAAHGKRQAEEAAKWRPLALDKAHQMRARFPDRSLLKIAQSIAGEVTLELGLEQPLVSETVYEFLRQTDRTLMRHG